VNPGSTVTSFEGPRFRHADASFFLRKLLGTLAPDLGHRRFGEERPKVADPAALVNKDQKSDEGFA